MCLQLDICSMGVVKTLGSRGKIFIGDTLLLPHNIHLILVIQNF